MQDLALAHVAALATAGNSVSLGPTGVAAVVTEQCRAYQALADDPAMSARVERELAELIRTGSPGAIIYAALLLRKLERDVAPLLDAYVDDRRDCSVFTGGCVGTGSWLCEAVRWVITGEHWAHPERLLGYELETIERANWFELPSDKLLRCARDGRRTDGTLAAGRWVITFAGLFVAPEKLRRAGARLKDLPHHAAPHVRLYGALLIRVIEASEGEALLARLANSGVDVNQLVSRWFGLSSRVSSVPIEELVRALERWPDGGAR